MIADEKLEVAIKRDYLVVKHNDLIQRSKYDLSVAEQRAIAYICSMIKPVTPSAATFGAAYLLDYEFNIRDYAKVCGLPFGGKLYKETKALFRKLMTRIINVELDEDDLMLAWLDVVRMSKQSGLIRIRINPEMAPFLFDLQNNFTAYGLLNILAMKSQYSIRIYELLHSHTYKGEIIFELKDLKEKLMVENKSTYKLYHDFKRKLLDLAIEEINKYTDLHIRYEPVTKGLRKVIKVRFLMSVKPPTERLYSWTHVNNNLDLEEEKAAYDLRLRAMQHKRN